MKAEEGKGNTEKGSEDEWKIIGIEICTEKKTLYTLVRKHESMRADISRLPKDLSEKEKEKLEKLIYFSKKIMNVLLERGD